MAAKAGDAVRADRVWRTPDGEVHASQGADLWKRLQYLQDGQLSFLRTKDGAEIDFIIEKGGVVTPIEVKWTERPTLSDARHLLKFLQEQGPKAPHSYIICRCAYPMQLHPRITALPWFCL